MVARKASTNHLPLGILSSGADGSFLAVARCSTPFLAKLVERVGPYLTSASSASRRVICPPHKVCEGVGLGDLAEPSSGLPHRLRVRFWVINPSASSSISTVNSEPSVNRVTACLRLVCSSNCLVRQAFPPSPYVAFQAVLYSAGAGWVASIRASI